MKALLIFEEQEVGNALSLALDGRMGMDCTVARNVQSAFDRLLSDDSLDLIVMEDVFDNVKLIKYLLSVESQIPVVLIRKLRPEKLGVFPELSTLGEITDGPDLIGEVVALVEKSKDKFKTNKTEQEYCRIKTELLIRVVPLQSDVYIRLSDIKFVKLFRKGDTFDAKDLENYLNNRKLEYLYLKRSETEEFVRKLKVALAAILKSGKISPPDPPALAVDIHEAIFQLSETIGVTEDIQELVRQNVKVVLKGIRKESKLKKVLDNVVLDQSSYISSHSVLVAHVACSISSTISWVSDTTYEKLTFAALLHDLLLRNQRLAAIDNLTQLEGEAGMQFSAEEKQAFRQHPQAIAEFSQRFHELPADVDTILVQHHERPDGSGFPRGLNAQKISPLAALLIMAHDLVQAYMTEGGDPQKVLETYKKDYNHGAFKAVVEAIQ